MPGVRENGGQYTHAGIWVAMAFAQIGDGERAWELFNLLNPVHHGDSLERIAIYKVEPYVIAADVYGVAPHMGRGGWTWYTGSASWMYRLLVETLLGIHLEGDKLRLAPHLPVSWPGYKIHYRFRQAVYHISVSRRQPRSEVIRELKLDGILISGDTFPLADDHQEHQVEMSIS
jgi:cellobiose phosphorylase